MLMRFHLKGMTLTELVMVVVIIGILAGLALPQFRKAFEATKAKEAVASLKQIRTAERAYRMEEKTYFYSDTTLDDKEKIREINKMLNVYLDVRDERNWDYSISRRTPYGRDDFMATATRINTSPPYNNTTITLDDTGPPFGGDWPLLPISEE